MMAERWSISGKLGAPRWAHGWGGLATEKRGSMQGGGGQEGEHSGSAAGVVGGDIDGATLQK